MKIRIVLRIIRNIVIWFIMIVAILSTIILLGGYLYYSINYKEFVDNTINNMSYDDFKLSDNQTLYFSNGKKMLLYSPYQKETITNPDDITTIIKNTVLAAEDERFYQHKGVDIKSITRACIFIWF